MCKSNFDSVDELLIRSTAFNFDSIAASPRLSLICLGSSRPATARGSTGPCQSRYPSWGGLGGVECGGDACVLPTRSAIHSVLLRKHRTNSHTPTWPPAPRLKHLARASRCAHDRRSAARARVALVIRTNKNLCLYPDSRATRARSTASARRSSKSRTPRLRGDAPPPSRSLMARTTRGLP